MSKYEEIAKVLKTLTHPIYLQIITDLLKDGYDVFGAPRKLNLPQSAAYQYLRILRNTKMINGEEEITKICCRVKRGLIRKTENNYTIFFLRI